MLDMLSLCIEGDIVGRSVIFILVSGLSVFWNFNGSDFVASCKHDPALIAQLVSYFSAFQDINLPIFASLYFGWKIFKKTKIVRII